MASVEPIFNKACDQVKIQKDIVGKLSNDIRGQIYGLFKQAKEGDNTKAQPSVLKLEENGKWKAWTVQKGKNKEAAMKDYIELARKVLPKDAAALIC